jgi:hypothetical protein
MKEDPPRQDPLPEVEWEVWYRDTFDLECPPSVDIEGRGLVQGLAELWARFLFETVRPGGAKGFSRFHLRWGASGTVIDGSWKGATRLRQWLFGAKNHTQQGYVAEADPRLLHLVALCHANLIAAGQTAEPILRAAEVAEDRQQFEARLDLMLAH